VFLPEQFPPFLMDNETVVCGGAVRDRISIRATSEERRGGASIGAAAGAWSVWRRWRRLLRTALRQRIRFVSRARTVVVAKPEFG
jgi:hypothetical protein